LTDDFFTAARRLWCDDKLRAMVAARRLLPYPSGLELLREAHRHAPALGRILVVDVPLTPELAQEATESHVQQVIVMASHIDPVVGAV
jgi:hypothetical protein